MDTVLAAVGRFAGTIGILMLAPLFYVFGPTVMALFGMMPWETSQEPWRQAEPFAVPYVVLWVVCWVLYAIGKAADDRNDKKHRGRDQRV